jgi:AraC-like DNA-binding protein
MTDARPTRPVENRLLFRNDASTPLGRLTAAGFIRDSAGVGPAPRLLGRYAIVYLLEGSGRYSDAEQRRVRVQAGDLIVVFPDVAHRYGPDPGERWSEFYVVFDGPVFDLYRRSGLLDPRRPVQRLEPVDAWLARLEDAVARDRPRTLAERTLEVSRFLGVLTEMLVPGADEPAGAAQPEWLARACELLETELHLPREMVEVAAAVGLPYETFRKQFQRHVGVSPARYRATRRIDTACAMLRSPGQTVRAVALSLGFSDEYHFSRRFKQITGLSPREFRRRLPVGDPARHDDTELP